MSIIVVAGRLARDAEARYLTDGTAVAGFSVAENIRVGNEQQAQFWECSLWGKRAESLAPYLKKGGAVTVCGEPRQEKYTGKDGIERSVVKIRVNDITLQGSKQDGVQAQTPPPPQRQSQQVDPQDDIDDDIPF